MQQALGAIAVVDVEVGDGDALEAVMMDGVGGADPEVAVEAEAHRPVVLGMVARRAYPAEGDTRVAVEDAINALYHRPGRAPRRGQGPGIHRRVVIDGEMPLLRQVRLEPVEIGGVVHAQELLAGDRGRLDVAQHHVQAAGDQLILDRIEALWALGMVRAHLVTATVGVGDVDDGHEIVRPSAVG